MAAKKSKKSAVDALSGRRLMTQEIMNYVFDMPSPAVNWTLQKFGYNNQAGAAAQQRFIWAETYFDFSGYERDHMTIFPEKITVQEGGSFRLKEDNSSVRTGMQVLDLITEESLDVSAMDDIVNLMYDQESAPSFSKGPLEFSQLIYGRYRMLGRDSSIWTPTTGNLTVLNTTHFGSGSPTTCAKLWVYRIIMPLGTLLTDTDDFIVIPPARYVMAATISKEKDSAYMMRQKNSYELAKND